MQLLDSTGQEAGFVKTTHGSLVSIYLTFQAVNSFYEDQPELLNDFITAVVVEQPLTLPGFTNNHYIPLQCLTDFSSGKQFELQLHGGL